MNYDKNTDLRFILTGWEKHKLSYSVLAEN